MREYCRGAAHARQPAGVDHASLAPLAGPIARRGRSARPSLSRHSAAAVAVAAVAAAALCLTLAFALLPSAPSYDAWAWLVWGRELLALELDASAGPSWKPLPVLIAAPLSAFGEVAPELWLAVVRVAWLATIVLAYRLAARLAGRRASTAGRGSRTVPRIAGVLAAAALLLLQDPQVPWLRHFAHGLSEPLLVAFVLGAIDRHLDGRGGQALLLAALAALVRPEAWPFLVLYALYRCRSRRPWFGLYSTAHRRSEAGSRRWTVAAVISVPALWLGGNLVGPGAASSARVDALAASPGEALDRIWTVAALALELPLTAAWLLAAAMAALAWRREGDWLPAVLLAGALAWVAVVAAERVLGYAALARFMLPAAAVACVLGAVRAAWLWDEARGCAASPPWPPRRDRAIAAVALAVLGVATAPAVIERAAALDGHAAEAAARGQEQRELTAAVATAGGSEQVARCGRASVGDFVLAPGLAWRLELPLSEVASVRARSLLSGGPVVVLEDTALAARLARQGSEVAGRVARVPDAHVLGSAGRFTLFGLPCERDVAPVLAPK